MKDVEDDEIEEFSDMAGVQREERFDSRHAPPAGEPDCWNIEMNRDEDSELD
jgi:hypothetical protein